MAFKIFKPKKYHVGMTGDEVKKSLEKVEKNTNVITSDDYNVVLTPTNFNTLITTGALSDITVEHYNAEEIPDYIWVNIQGFGLFKLRFSSVIGDEAINYSGVYYIQAAANTYQIVVIIRDNVAVASALPVG